MLNDTKTVERFGSIVVKEKLAEYDEDALASWTLRHDYAEKNKNTHDDEFEYDEAKTWALEKFKEKISKVKKFDVNQEFKLNLSAKIGTYDFKAKSFPIEALTPNAYINFRGNGYFVRGGKLLFDNATADINNIPMEKAKAKIFIKSRKRNGHIDRKLTATYIYTIKEYEETNAFQPGRAMSLELTAILKSVEFADSKTGKVIWKANYPSSDDIEKIRILKEFEKAKNMPFGKDFISFKEKYPSMNLAEFSLYLVEAKREIRNLGIIEKLHPSGKTDSDIRGATSIDNLFYGNGSSIPERSIPFKESKKIKSHLKKIILKDMNITNGTVSDQTELEKIADVIIKVKNTSKRATYLLRLDKHVEVDSNLKEINIQKLTILKGDKYLSKEIYNDSLSFRYLYDGEDAIKFDFKYDEAIYYFRLLSAGSQNSYAILQLVDNVHGAQKMKKENK